DQKRKYYTAGHGGIDPAWHVGCTQRGPDAIGIEQRSAEQRHQRDHDQAENDPHAFYMACGSADCQRRKIAGATRPRHNDAMNSDIAEEPPGDPTYAFKASLIGSMCQFTLKPDALE